MTIVTGTDKPFAVTIVELRIMLASGIDLCAGRLFRTERRRRDRAGRLLLLLHLQQFYQKMER